MAHRSRDTDKAWWLDSPRNVDKMVWSLYGLCALLVISDVFINRYGEFEIEHAFGFYCLFGFLASLCLVLIAKQLRRILGRSEGYYDR